MVSYKRTPLCLVVWRPLRWNSLTRRAVYTAALLCLCCGCDSKPGHVDVKCPPSSKGETTWSCCIKRVSIDRFRLKGDLSGTVEVVDKSWSPEKKITCILEHKVTVIYDPSPEFPDEEYKVTLRQIGRERRSFDWHQRSASPEEGWEKARSLFITHLMQLIREQIDGEIVPPEFAPQD